MNYDFSISEYVSIIRRNLFVFILVAVAVASVGVPMVVSIPSVYKAEGVILVESQQIPSNIVASTVTSAAVERIRVIEKRVLVRAQILDIIDKYQLFGGTRSGASPTGLVDRFRKGVGVEVRSIDSGRRRGGSGSSSTLFSLSFQHGDPEVALNVVNELITRFLEENIRVRTTRAVETTEFLTTELARLETEIDAQEQEIIAFKTQNQNALPEHLSLHFSMLERAKRDVLRSEDEIRQAREAINLRESELSSLETGRVSDENEGLFTPQRELLQLQSTLSELLLNYTEGHPEVRSTAARIKVLEDRIKALGESRVIAKELAALEVERDQLLTSGGNNSPELKALNEKIDALRPRLQQVSGNEFENIDRSYALQEARLKLSIEVLETRINDSSNNIERFRTEVADLEQRIQLTPLVESELRALERTYQQTLSEFQSMQGKLRTAELAQNLEQEQKAERFRVIEPPVKPEKPEFPNRPRLLVMVLIMAGGIGATIAFGPDFVRGTVQSGRQLAQIVGSDRVIEIPYITLEADLQRRKTLIISMVIGVPVVALLALIATHFFVSSLDVYFYRFLGGF